VALALAAAACGPSSSGRSDRASAASGSAADSGATTASLPGPRLAVLPLANLTGDPARTYFVEGTLDRLISEAGEAGLTVVARSSVLRYANRAATLDSIARALGADALLDGGVAREGDGVTIRVRLVDAASGDTTWSRTFAGGAGDLDALHRELIAAVARELGVELEPGAAARAAGAWATDPAAYDAYLRGVFHARLFTLADLETALGDFRRALAIDSTYAPAWLETARVWLYRGDAGPRSGVTAAEARRRWEPALERALELGPELPGAHRLLAEVRAGKDRDFAAADSAFGRAVELNPSHAETRIHYARLLAVLGRPGEADRHAAVAVRLDPVNPFTRGLYGKLLFLTGRYDEAIGVLEPILARYPGARFARPPLAGAYEMEGRREDAFRVRLAGARERDDAELAAALERGRREGGYAGALRRAAGVLAVRVRSGEGPPGSRPRRLGIARLYAAAGDSEKALDWLEEAVAAEEPDLACIGILPTFAPLRDTPRFRELVGRAGMPLAGPPQRSAVSEPGSRGEKGM